MNAINPAKYIHNGEVVCMCVCVCVHACVGVGVRGCVGVILFIVY